MKRILSVFLSLNITICLFLSSAFAAKADAGFSDVSPDDWFHAAVAWCQQEHLISGYTPQTFDPMGLLSREQMTVILHNYARYLGTTLRSNADLSRFSDGDSVEIYRQEETGLWERLRAFLNHGVYAVVEYFN